MVLNSDRDASIKQLISHLRRRSIERENEDMADLANCIKYMHSLWKEEVKRVFANGGREQ